MESTKLTRGTKELLKAAIAQADSNNRNDICAKVCEIVEEKYQGCNLEYQLERMGLLTTGKILEAIDIYFYKFHR